MNRSGLWRRAGITVALLLVAVSLSWLRLSSPRSVELAAGLRSRQTVAEAQRELQTSQAEWSVIEDSSLPPDDPRPPFDITTVSLAPFEHLGVTGELVLEFFNDRLVSVRFYPEQPRRYLEVLAESEAIDLSDRRGPTSRGGATIEKARDHRGRTYVIWSDPRLVRKRQRWVMRHS